MSYRRWRHTRGYGVHSPFAYRVVRDAVRPPRGYGYYGDHDIECALVENGCHDTHAERIGRFTLRLCDIIRPEKVFLSPAFPRPESTALQAALRAAGSGIAISRSLDDIESCGFLISYGDSAAGALEKAISGVGRTILLDCVSVGFQQRLFDSVKEGLWLEGNGTGVIFNRPAMARTSYTIFI